LPGIDSPPGDTRNEEHSGGSDDDIEQLREALKEVSEQKGALQAEVSSLQEALAREMYKINCTQLSEFDATLTAKNEEIAKLKEQFRCHSHSPSQPLRL